MTPDATSAVTMGSAGPFTPEKLVIGVLHSRPRSVERVVSELTSQWGPVDYRSEGFPFTFTRYYDEEMGTPIERLFLSFSRLVDPGGFADIKVRSNAIEDLFREEGRRTVNLDPGLMALSRFCLATTKESSHRIPLSDGIYAEVTLLYGKGGFRPLEWTYPDYRSERYARILGDIRVLYKGQLAAGE
jgi:hypothetical protein